MESTERKVSKRLLQFLENHEVYEDTGSPEYGPELSSYYDGPDWAINLYFEFECPEQADPIELSWIEYL